MASTAQTTPNCLPSRGCASSTPAMQHLSYRAVCTVCTDHFEALPAHRMFPIGIFTIRLRVPFFFASSTFWQQIQHRIAEMNLAFLHFALNDRKLRGSNVLGLHHFEHCISCFQICTRRFAKRNAFFRRMRCAHGDRGHHSCRDGGAN